jgi:GGDEF domain-containing protein
LVSDAFEFIFGRELTRASRSQNFLTLVMMAAGHEWEGITRTADESTIREVAQVVGREVREVDLLGRMDAGTLAMVLIDSDYELATRVVNRVLSRIENYEFPSALRMAIFAACYPTHAADLDSLKRQAVHRLMVNWRGGATTTSEDQN